MLKERPVTFLVWLFKLYIKQGCNFLGYSLNSGLHEVQILALLLIFSPFWRLLVQIHKLFEAIFFRSACIPDQEQSSKFGRKFKDSE